MSSYGGPFGSTSASALEANDDGILLGLVLISADADVDPDAAGGRLEVDLEASWRSIWSSLGRLLEVSRRSLGDFLEVNWKSIGRLLGNAF